MQVNNVLARHLEPRTQGKRGELLESLGGAGGPAALGRTAPTAGASQAAVQILQQYDVTSITPQKFSEMLQKLYDAGALTKDELRELSQVRMDLDGAGVGSDEPVNLLEFYGQKRRELAKKLENADPAATAEQKVLQQSAAALEQRLDWLQKFAAMHATPEAMSINALA